MTLYGSNFPVVGTVSVQFGSSQFVATVNDATSSSTVMYCSAPLSYPSRADIAVSLFVGGYLLSTNTILYGYRGEPTVCPTFLVVLISLCVVESPILTSIVPDVVPQTGNIAVTLYGSYLFEDTVTSLNVVALNGVSIDLSSATWDTVGAASVVVIVPPDTLGGTLDVYQVTFSYNNQEFSNAVPLTYVGELCVSVSS